MGGWRARVAAGGQEAIDIATRSPRLPVSCRMDGWTLLGPVAHGRGVFTLLRMARTLPQRAVNTVPYRARR